MKTFLKITVLLGLFMSLCCLSSCGKENDDNDYAATIAGTYVGQDNGSDVTKKAHQTKAIGAAVIITRESNNKVTIAYDNDGTTKSTATSYPSATVTKSSNGDYNISYNDKYIDMQIRGIVSGNSLILQRINYGTVEVNFLGNKQ